MRVGTRSVSKSTASFSYSAFSLPQQTSLAFVSLLISHQSTCHSPLTGEQDARIPKLLHLRQQIIPNLEWALYPFSASHLEALILNLTTSHSAKNCPIVSWRSWLDEFIRTTSFAKALLPYSLTPPSGQCFSVWRLHVCHMFVWILFGFLGKSSCIFSRKIATKHNVSTSVLDWNQTPNFYFGSLSLVSLCTSGSLLPGCNKFAHKNSTLYPCTCAAADFSTGFQWKTHCFPPSAKELNYG